MIFDGASSLESFFSEFFTSFISSIRIIIIIDRMFEWWINNLEIFLKEVYVLVNFLND